MFAPISCSLPSQPLPGGDAGDDAAAAAENDAAGEAGTRRAADGDRQDGQWAGR